MDKLNELIKLCKCGVHLTINGHKDYYESIEDHFKQPLMDDYIEEIEKDVYDKMVDIDTMIELQFYPNTPTGFYKVYHYDVEKAIDIALQTLKK